MKQHSFGNCQTMIDMDATAKWYAQYKGWHCDCGHCRNFLALASQKALPERTLAVLAEFGIPPEKPTYVCTLDWNDESLLYQCSYRIAGNITKAAFPDGTEDGETGRVFHEPYPYGAPGFPEPHFDIEFIITLPWALDEPQS